MIAGLQRRGLVPCKWDRGKLPRHGDRRCDMDHDDAKRSVTTSYAVTACSDFHVENKASKVSSGSCSTEAPAGHAQTNLLTMDPLFVVAPRSWVSSSGLGSLSIVRSF